MTTKETVINVETMSARNVSVIEYGGNLHQRQILFKPQYSFMFIKNPISTEFIKNAIFTIRSKPTCHQCFPFREGKRSSPSTGLSGCLFALKWE